MLPLISVTGRFLQVFFMNEFNNLTNVVIGILGKLVHKQIWKHDNNINTNIAGKKITIACTTRISNTKWAVGSI